MSVRPWSGNAANTLLPPSVFFGGGQGLRLFIPFSGGELAAIFHAFRSTLGLSTLYVELAFPDEGEMEELNRESMACHGPTNILSFPALALPSPALPASSGETIPQMAPALLGSLALAPETALRESFLYGQEHSLYCLKLFAHGYAHLTGHEHGEVMEKVCKLLEEAAKKTLAE